MTVDDDDPGSDEEPPAVLAVLRRGWATSPELRRGLGPTLALALAAGASRVAVPIVVQQILDRVLRDGRVEAGAVARVALAGAVAVVAAALLTRVTQLRLSRAAEAALCGLRVRAFAHVHRLAVDDPDALPRGALVARVTADVEVLGVFLFWGGIAWVVNGAIAVAALVSLAVYDVRLAVVAGAGLVPVALFLRALQRRLVAAYGAVRRRLAQMLTVVSENVSGAAVVRAYGIEGAVDARALTAIERWRRAGERAGVLGGVLYACGELYAAGALAAVVVTGLVLGPDAGLSAGEVVAAVFLLNLLLEPVTELTELVDHSQAAVAGWRRVLDLLDLPVAVTEPDGGAMLASRPPALEVVQVTHRYPRPGPPGPRTAVLSDLSLTVPPGARVALVGPTGAGKTTLAKLLVRLADPTEGRILVDGVDLRRVDPASRRARLLLVPQDGFLFDTTVAANARRGRPDASDAEVLAAFATLGLDDWLAGLPAGPDTAVGPGGARLSAGERQLVALARAHLARPTCLILDEATSSVDPVTDRRLTRALAVLAADRTSVTIAHRLATAEEADEILVLDGGRLVERGTPAELRAAGGHYAGLHDRWLDGA